VQWCYFRHDHGSSPASFIPGHKPAFGYAPTAAGVDEPHPGFKSYAFDDGAGHRWLLTHHFGTGSINRACTRFHGVNVAVANASSGELLADLHYMADFGKSVVNTSGEPLVPAQCPNQASQADADGSRGVRMLPVLTRQALGYEPWRMDSHRTILGVTGDITFNTPDAVVICDDVRCNRPVPTNETGTRRFFTYSRDLGVTAGRYSGTFYTDAYGRIALSPGQPGAVRQYVKPGLSLKAFYYGDEQTCYTIDTWTAWYRCDATASQGVSIDLEGAITAPN
ncbi:MAG: hypothetical protein M3442_04100, partial [Chloroflexota bacterium]|nr:hypothetical protein [Chloroflexota bacterium]